MFECASRDACKMQQNLPGTDVISVIFLDEMDSLAGQRSDDKFMATTVNALLQVMDGVKEFPNTTLIGATNLPWNLDSAILRRFTTSIYVKLPQMEDIYSLFSLEITNHIENIVGASDAAKITKFCNSVMKKSKKPKVTVPPGGVGDLREILQREAGTSSTTTSSTTTSSTTTSSTTSSTTSLCERKKAKSALWQRPPYSNLMKNLDPLKLRALAKICNNELYSNSDISRLFQNVVQRAADQAVSNNTFISYSEIPDNRFISTLSLEPHDLYRVWSENPSKFEFLIPPENLKIVVGATVIGTSKEYYNQSLRPFLIYQIQILQKFLLEISTIIPKRKKFNLMIT